MRDGLPDSPKEGECGVLNLDSSDGPGTHWTAWAVLGTHITYFDSYGLPPPKELVLYWRSRWSLNAKPLLYSTMKIQNRQDPPVCGHLCIEFLKRVGSQPFGDVLLMLRGWSI